MGRPQETFNKKEVRNKKEKKKKEKEKKKILKKDTEKSGNLEDMLMYVDENGNLTSTPPDPNRKKEVIDSELIEVSVRKRDPNAIPDPIRKGVVTFFNDSKGFGFIKDSETQESIFVHINNLLDDIKENNIVTFEVGQGQKGPAAMNVKVVR